MIKTEAAPHHTRRLLTGDHAVAQAAMLAKPHVIPVYPITPQTQVLERLCELSESKELTADLMTVESEHSAMAACIAASRAGARVFTATASQGLALMHEMLHFAAGSRTPVVMVNVNRTLAAPWGFWADQTDSLSQRDTGWIQIYSESAQEALDNVIQAFRVAESVSLPAMVVIEALYISHTLEPVDVPDQELVDHYLPRYDPPVRLDVANPRGFGNTASPAQYRATRLSMQAAMDEAKREVIQAGKAYGEITGRSYGQVELYRGDDAELILVSSGGVAGTAREAVDRLREAGLPVGLLKIRLFRPFPAEEVTRILGGARRVAVIDRNLSVGCRGIFAQEVRAALYNGLERRPPLFDFIAGLGGTDVSPELIEKIARHAVRRPVPPSGPIWEEEL